jgi:two-component system cell cycle sensor histidine kinase/response regulator CckA
MNAIVGEMERMLGRVIGEDIQLVFRPATGLAPVCADPGQLEQVIMNLALNARDAMADGGTLTLSTATIRDSGADATAHVVLTVADTGVGMDEATLAQAFEPFFTTKATGHGTGLGLPTVLGIVKQSGGRVEVESEPGIGTTLRVVLPAHSGAAPTDEPAPSPAPVAAAPRARKGSGTILLVEDEPAVRGIARRALSRYGYQVVEAGNGIEALARLEGGTETIDLILSDLVMPGMGGRELAERLRDFPSPPPVLFMSGYAEGDMLPVQAEIGSDHPGPRALPRFLEKPFTVDQLVSAVAAIL